MHFFLAGDPPTITAQERRIGKRKDGSLYIYEDRELKEVRMQLRARLSKVAPEDPMDGPLRLVVKWMFPNGQHKHGTYKTTKPDTDNLNKMLKDVMTDMGFWKDDALIAIEEVWKMYSDEPGIVIRIETLNPDIANEDDERIKDSAIHPM